MRWEAVGRSVHVCFLIGQRDLPKGRRRAVEAEAARHGDIFMLDVADRVVLTLPKTFGWWQAAALLLAPAAAEGASSPLWVAKVDDDSFVHLPNLEAGLRRLHCRRHLYYGHFAQSGYNPEALEKCGFSWTGSDNYRRYGCRARGAEPPSLFALGAVQVLAAPLLQALAAAPELPAFVARAHELRRQFSAKHDAAEDVALGWWLAKVRPAAGVDYVRVPDHSVYNMDCFKPRGGFYSLPDDDAIVVHHLKRPSGMGYLWRLLHDRAPHEPNACLTATLDTPGMKNARIVACHRNHSSCRRSWTLNTGRPAGGKTLSCSFTPLTLQERAAGKLGGRRASTSPANCCACGYLD